MIESLSDLQQNTWYLAEAVIEDKSGYCIAVRGVNGIMQIAVKTSKNDFWCAVGTFEDTDYTVTDITQGSDTLVIREEVLRDYMRPLHCTSYEYVIAVPGNVNYWYEV